jgi:hypothetical protein
MRQEARNGRTRQQILAALLSGTGFTSLLLLLLKMLPVLIVSVAISTLLIPGGALVSILFRPKEFNPPLAVLAANSFVYSVVFYFVLAAFWRHPSPGTIRRVTIRLAAPAVILLGLVCVPAFNPLWPRGLDDLTKEENELRAALPLGSELNQVRALLSSKGFQFREEVERSATVVLRRGDKSITAAAGDRVLSAKLQTQASQFPCGYDMEIVLLFGSDNSLKQQHIGRLRVCP